MLEAGLALGIAELHGAQRKVLGLLPQLVA